MKTGWQRTQADFENYKKRVEQDKQSWREEAKLDVFSRLIPLLDNISLATKHIPQAIVEDPWVQGITHISRQIEQELEGLGIVKIMVKNRDKFDHNIHEAVESRADKSYNNDEIIEVRSEGYTLREKVIRPSRVIVCKND